MLPKNGVKAQGQSADTLAIGGESGVIAGESGKKLAMG